MARTIPLCVALLVIVSCILKFEVVHSASIRSFTNSRVSGESAAYDGTQDGLCPCGDVHDEGTVSSYDGEKPCNEQVIRLLQNTGKAISKVGSILRSKDTPSAGNHASATINFGGHGSYPQAYPFGVGFNAGQGYPGFQQYSAISPRPYGNTASTTRGSSKVRLSTNSARQSNEYFVQLANGQIVPLSLFADGSQSHGQTTSSTTSSNYDDIYIVLANGEKVPYNIYKSIVNSFDKEESVDVTLLDGDTYEAETYDEFLELTNGEPDSIVNLPEGQLVTAATYEAVINAYQHHQVYVQLPSGDMVPMITFSKPSAKFGKSPNQMSAKKSSTSNASKMGKTGVSSSTSTSMRRGSSGANTGSSSIRKTSSDKRKYSTHPRTNPSADENTSDEVISDDDDEETGSEEETDSYYSSRSPKKQISTKSGNTSKSSRNSSTMNRGSSGTNTSSSTKKTSMKRGKDSSVPTRNDHMEENASGDIISQDSDETEPDDDSTSSTSYQKKTSRTMSTKNNAESELVPDDTDDEKSASSTSSSSDSFKSTQSNRPGAKVTQKTVSSFKSSTDEDETHGTNSASFATATNYATEKDNGNEDDDTPSGPSSMKTSSTTKATSRRGDDVRKSSVSSSITENTESSERIAKPETPESGNPLMSSTKTSSSSTTKNDDDDIHRIPIDTSSKSRFDTASSASSGSTIGRKDNQPINEDGHVMDDTSKPSLPDTEQSARSTTYSTTSNQEHNSPDDEKTPMSGSSTLSTSSTSRTTNNEDTSNDGSFERSSQHETKSYVAIDSEDTSPSSPAGRYPSKSSKNENTASYTKTVTSDGKVQYTPVDEREAESDESIITATSTSRDNNYSGMNKPVTDSDWPSTSSKTSSTSRMETNNNGNIRYGSDTPDDSLKSSSMSSDSTKYTKVTGRDGQVHFVPTSSATSSTVTTYKKTTGPDGEIRYIPSSNNPSSTTSTQGTNIDRESGSSSSTSAKSTTKFERVVGPNGQVQYIPVDGSLASETSHRTIVDSTGNTYKLPTNSGPSSQSYKTVTDTKGNTYRVDDNGQIHPISPQNHPGDSTPSRASSSVENVSYLTIADKRGNTYQIPNSESSVNKNSGSASTYVGEDGRIHYNIPTTDADATSLNEDQIKEGLKIAASEYIIFRSADGQMHYIPKSAAPVKKITTEDGTTYEIPVVPSSKKTAGESISYHKFTSPDGLVYDVPTGKTPDSTSSGAQQKTTITMEKITSPDGSVYEVPVETTINSNDGTITTKVTYTPSSKNQFKTILEKNGNVYMVPISGSSSLKTSPILSLRSKVKTVIDSQGNVQYVPLNTPSFSTASRTVVDINDDVYEIPAYITPVGHVSKQGAAPWKGESSMSSSSSSYDLGMNSKGYQGLNSPCPPSSQEDSVSRRQYHSGSAMGYGGPASGSPLNSRSSSTSQVVYLDGNHAQPLCASTCPCHACA